MKKTMKRIVSVVLALAMVVTSLNYTPKTVEAAEDYSSLTYKDITNNGFADLNGTSLSGSQYAFSGDEVVINPFQYQGVGMKDLYMAFPGNWATGLKVTANGKDAKIDGNQAFVVAADTVFTYEYNVINISSNAGSAKLIIWCKENAGKGTYEESTTEPETEPTEPTNPTTLKAPEDAYVYNLVEGDGGFKVGFSNPNKSKTWPEGYTYTYTLNINGKKIENIQKSGDSVDLSGLELEEGKEYAVTMNAVYQNGDYSVTSPESATTKFTYKTTKTEAYDNGIAKVFFTTSSGTDLDVNGLYNGSQNNKPKVPTAITVQKADGTVDTADYGTANVRGNSTANADKKPFNFKLTTKKDVLSMGVAKKWSLLANGFDKTLIRNQIGLDFQRSLEESQEMFADGTSKAFTSNCQPVDLYIDGNFVGTYTLVESVQVGDSRVKIDINYADEDTDDLIADATADEVTIDGTTYQTYDALLELANDSRLDSEAYYFKTGLEQFAINEPEHANSTYPYEPGADINQKPVWVGKTQAFVQAFETALQGGNYDVFSQFIDVDSFVDFYITSELFMTKDINFSSTRFYIRDGKLYAGPLWDLDLSSGNIGDHEAAKDFWAQAFKWFELLMQNETFATKVKTKYAALQGKIKNLYATDGEVDRAYNTVKASAIHNYEDAYTYGKLSSNGWKYTYVYGNGGHFDQAELNLTAGDALTRYGVYGSVTVHDNYEAYVTDYKTWLKDRNEWLLANWNIELETGVYKEATNNHVMVAWDEIEGAIGYTVTYTPATTISTASLSNDLLEGNSIMPLAEGDDTIDVSLGADVTQYDFTENNIALKDGSKVTVTANMGDGTESVTAVDEEVTANLSIINRVTVSGLDATITTNVTNSGLASAENVNVQFKSADGTVVEEKTITGIPADQTGTVTFTTNTAGDHSYTITAGQATSGVVYTCQTSDDENLTYGTNDALTAGINGATYVQLGSIAGQENTFAFDTQGYTINSGATDKALYVRLNGIEVNKNEETTAMGYTVRYAALTKNAINEIQLEWVDTDDSDGKTYTTYVQTLYVNVPEGEAEAAPDYSGITVADDNWAKIETGATFTHNPINSPADGSTWKMGVSYYNNVKNSAYIQFASSGKDLTYGGGTNNTITGPAFAFSAKDYRNIESVWVNNTKLEIGTDYCRNEKNADGTYGGDVICLAQSLFKSGETTYVTLRYTDGDKIIPIKVEEKTVDQSGIVIPALDDSNWTAFKNDAVNSSNVAANGDKFYVLSSVLDTLKDYNGTNVGLYANTSSLEQPTWGNPFTGEDANMALFAYTRSSGANVKSVTIDGTTYTADGVNVCSGDVVYVKQALFDLQGQESHIFKVTVEYSNEGMAADAFALKVVKGTEDTTTSGEDVTVPDINESDWIKMNDASGSANTDDFYYYIPTGNTIGFVPGNSNELINTVLLVFSEGLSAATFNGTSISFNGAGVEISKNDLTESGKAYVVQVSNAAGQKATVYIKKEAAKVYAPTGLAASVKNSVATVLWTPGDDADETFTYEVTIGGETASVSGTTATFDMTDKDYGDYEVVLTTKNAEGDVIDTQKMTLKYKDPEAVDSTLTVTKQWEARRWEVLSWDAVENATGYAIYADGKLFTTTTDITYNLPAYAFANTENANGQKTTVGTHNVKVVALFDNAEAPATADEINSKHLIGSDDATLYVNYVYGNGTDIWNTSGVDSDWNFTICESADDPNISEGADVKVTYKDDKSADLVFNNMGTHAGGDQPWTIKAALYDQPVAEGGLINLSFDIDGPASLAGSDIMIKCTPEEMNADGGYAGDPYEEAKYTFEPVYGDDGKTVVASVLHYSNSFESKNSTYDLFFGLGELKFTEDEKTLTLSDPKEVKVYGLKTLNATGIANVDEIDNSSIYVSWTTDVPVRLESEYTYQVYIDDKPVDENAKSGTSYPGYGEGEHTVKVVSVYNGANTSELTTTAAIVNEAKPDLVITEISVPTQEWFVDDTVPITITMKNIGNADAVVEVDNLTVQLFVNGVYNNFYTQDSVDGVQTLEAGKSLTKTINYKIEENLVDGEHNSSYVIKAVADADSKVNESNENNNEYERTFTFNARLNDLTLENDGRNVSASWEPEEGASQYVLRYYLNGEKQVIYVDGNTTTYTFPAGDEPDNNSEVNVYAQGSDNSYYQIAKGTALADLIIESLTLENGVAFVKEENYIIAVVKNIGTAKANAGEGQAQITAVTFTNTDVYTGYGTRDNDILDPNQTFEIRVDKGPYIPISVGKVTLTAIADDINRIPESDRRNNTASIDVVAIERGTLELTNNDGTVTATWTDPNVNDTENTLVAEEYQLTYISNGVTVTKNVTNGSFDFEDAIDNNTTVEISVKYEGIDGYHKLAETTALADLIIETIKQPENTYLNEAFDVVVTIKNQGTAQVPASEEEFVEGYGGWIIVSMGQYNNFNDNALMKNHTADGLLAGKTADITISGIKGTVLSDPVNGDTLTFKVDSPGFALAEGTGFITESDETNNTKDIIVHIVKKPFTQVTEMDWTPLYDVNNENQNGTDAKYPFDIAGTTGVNIEYKILDTTITDKNYADIMVKYGGYGGQYIAMGITDDHNLLNNLQVENPDDDPTQWTFSSKTTIYTKQVRSDYCENYNDEQGSQIKDSKYLDASKNANVVDTDGNILAEKTSLARLTYDGNGYQYYVAAWGLGKYYAMVITDEAGNSITVGFRVTTANGRWNPVDTTDGAYKEQLPVYYHEKEGAYQTTASYFYDASDPNIVSISAHGGGWFSILLGQDTPLHTENDVVTNDWRIDMAYAVLDEEGNPVEPEDGWVQCDDKSVLRPEGKDTVIAPLAYLMKELPVHSDKGGERDDKYYYMRVYYNTADHPDDYVLVPIKVTADIPKIDAVQDLNAEISPIEDNGHILKVSWAETENQSQYDYHYDVKIYKVNEDGTRGDLIKEDQGAGSHEYTDTEKTSRTYNVEKDLGIENIANQQLEVVVVARWCDQTVETEKQVKYEYHAAWKKISGTYNLSVTAGNEKKVNVLGTISFYDDAEHTNVYDVSGYNGVYVNIYGSTNYIGSNGEDDNGSQVYISNGVSSESELTNLEATNEMTKDNNGIYLQTGSNIQMNTESLFNVSYRITYYNVKIVKGDRTTVVKMKVEVEPGDVAVMGFQMNTDTSEGGVSEFNPSFRVVSRASNIVSSGDTFTITNTDDTEGATENVALATIKSYGTLYTRGDNKNASDLKFDSNIDYSEQVKAGEKFELGEGSEVFSFEATKDVGTLTNWADATDANSTYYAVTFKNTRYSVDLLTKEYKIRAYAVTDNGTIIYSNVDDVKNTTIEQIAATLYNGSMMAKVEDHNFLYDNVLNIVAIKRNRLSIAKAMISTLKIDKTSDAYTYVNNAYKDMYNYVYFLKPYSNNDAKYYQRGAFKLSDAAQENALTEALNNATSTSYGSVAEWIAEQVTENGFYKTVAYSPKTGTAGTVEGSQE